VSSGRSSGSLRCRTFGKICSSGFPGTSQGGREYPWRPARLGAGYSNDTWRLWTFEWKTTPGRHSVTARATDNTGAVQTEQPAPPAPDVATGWPTISVEVK
jgi:hypothetical protein